MKANEFPAEVSAALTTIAWYFAGLMLDAAKQRASQDADGAGYYDAKSSPMGPTGFLRLAREGAFPTFRMGRKLVAKRADVHAFIESQERRKASTPKPQPRKGPRTIHDDVMAYYRGEERDTGPSTERSS